MKSVPSLSLERATDKGGISLVSLKIQTNETELNVAMTQAELESLSRIRAADWNQRSSIRAGTSAGSPVFWCCDSEAVTVLVGLDDESWDIAFTLPASFASDLIRVAEEL